MRYAKIFDSIWEGSMRGKSDSLFVFINLLTHSDRHGIVDRHWRAISDETGLSENQIREAIRFLESPDLESRTPDEEGRRIVRLDSHREWGWRIVNHCKYRDLCSKAQNAERVEKHRKSKEITVQCNGSVTHSNILPVGVGVDVAVCSSELELGLDNKEVKEEKKERSRKDEYAEHPDFLAFWSAYPLKDEKHDALKCWLKYKKEGVLPELDVVLKSLEDWKKSYRWTKEGGQYIRAAPVWLNKRSWEGAPAEKKMGVLGKTASDIEAAKKRFQPKQSV